MKNYIVELVSKDRQILQVRVHGARSLAEAKKMGLQRVKELGWEMYEYKIQRVTPIE